MILQKGEISTVKKYAHNEEENMKTEPEIRVIDTSISQEIQSPANSQS